MSKGKLLPFTGNWHLELANDKDVEAKARKSLREAEAKEVRRVFNEPRKIITPPATGWSDPKEELFTVEELAKHWRVNPCSIYKAVKQGELVSEGFGKVLRFGRAQIDAYKTKQLMKRRYG